MRNKVIFLTCTLIVGVSISYTYSTSMMEKAKQLLEAKAVIEIGANNEWNSIKGDMQQKLQGYLSKYEPMVNQYNAMVGNNPNFAIKEVPHKFRVKRILGIINEKY